MAVWDCVIGVCVRVKGGYGFGGTCSTSLMEAGWTS